MVGHDDLMLVFTFVVSIVLVSQTTWAIASEGEGHHVEQDSPGKLAVLAHVRPWKMVPFPKTHRS